MGRLGLTPDGLTLIGFGITVVGAALLAAQLWLVGGIVVFIGGVFDMFDGTLARATGQTSKLGAFLDSTFDRAGEGIVYIGIAAGSAAAGFSQGAVLAGAAMAASFMVSYTRAKAESLGFSPGSGLMNVGLAPREVRLAMLAIGLVWTSVWQPLVALDSCTEAAPGVLRCAYGLMSHPYGYLVLSATLGLITTLATITTVQRILHVRAQSKEG